MVVLMKSWPDTGYRVGKITEDDKYGDAPLCSSSARRRSWRRGVRRWRNSPVGM